MSTISRVKGQVLSRRPAGLEGKLRDLASTRQLDDLTIGPVLSWTTDAMLQHAQRLLQIPGGCGESHAGACLCS